LKLPDATSLYGTCVCFSLSKFKLGRFTALIVFRSIFDAVQI
jgi:hypothetical protein